MKASQSRKQPKRKPFQLVLNDRERDRVENIADLLGVSLGEAVRHALMSYPLESKN